MRRLAACVAAATAVAGLAALPSAPAAGAASTSLASTGLVVDLAKTTGAFRGGASGVLYGLYDEGVPSDALIAGMGVQTVDTKAQDGQQHPGSDALEVAGPLKAATGGDVYVYMTDVYRNFPYERTSYAQYQKYLTAEVEQVMASKLKDNIVYVPYNEPDGNWFSGMDYSTDTAQAFVEEWAQTYRLIKSLDPDARIAGPNLTWYYETPLKVFLTYCKAHDCLPDVMTWHELGVTSTVRTDTAAYRALEQEVGVDALPINLNEYSSRYMLTNPAQMVGWLSALEDTKVDGDLAYWNVSGTLGDSTAEQNVPNAQWWLYHWYSQLSGRTVAVTPRDDNADYTLQGLATLDTAKRQARIVLGGGAPATATVTVKNVDPDVFGTTVHATVLDDAWSGILGSASQPVRVSDADVTVGADGSVSVPISDDAEAQRSVSACRSGDHHVSARIDGGLKLCGESDYVSLPTGVVSSLKDFTISAWVNPSVSSTWSRVFDLGTGTANNMFLTVDSGSGVRFAITTTGPGGEQQINGTKALPANTWSHVAVTLSGGVGTLYVDGTAVGTNSAMTLTPSDLGTTTKNYLGRSQYADPYLQGTLDDVQIYSRALSAAQVSDLAGGQAGAGDVADYRLDETSGTALVDASGSGHGAVYTTDPTAVAPSTHAYEVILSPGGTGSSSPVDATWTRTYEAEDAALSGATTINTEGSASNTWGLTTSNGHDVSGFTTGSDARAAFSVTVPSTGDYDLRTYGYAYAGATDVDGPTSVFATVDDADPVEVQVPVSYETQGWATVDSTVHLTAGTHTVTFSTVGADGAVTHGTAAIDKIDLSLKDPAVQGSTVYEAEQATLDGAKTAYTAQGQSGAGAVTLGRGDTTTFWVSATADGYADVALRMRTNGTATTTVNGLTVAGSSSADGTGWRKSTARVWLAKGVNRVVATGAAASAVVDELTVTPIAASATAVKAHIATYQFEDGTLTGTAEAVGGHDHAVGKVVTGVADGSANTVSVTVKTTTAGRYALSVRFANAQQVDANHYNPDLMTAPIDLSVNGAATVHYNVGNTFSDDQFHTLTIPVTLAAGVNTLRFQANQQYDWDGTTVGVVFSGAGIGAEMRSKTAPTLDELTVAPLLLTTR